MKSQLMKLLNSKAFRIFLINFFIITKAFSQSASERDELIKRQLEEMLKARDEMLKSLLNDSAFKDFDKHFEDMTKKFNLQNFEQNGFDTDGKILGEYDWQENDSEKIFLLKVKQIKDQPLDIKIEKGKILLKGDVEAISAEKGNLKKKKISKIHFERSISIPSDVDQSNPIFENKNGVVLIKFKKLNHSKKHSGNQPKQKVISPDNSVDMPTPIDKDIDDLSI